MAAPGACRIIIFSTDDLRGGITKQLLKRSGIDVRRVGSIPEVRESVAAAGSAALIIDTKNAIADELNFLQQFCLTFTACPVIVLGPSSMIDAFEGPCLDVNRRLADPLDPDLIISTVKHVLESQPHDDASADNNLESDLKEFLKLD